jgi:hypothetical protein
MIRTCGVCCPTVSFQQHSNTRQHSADSKDRNFYVQPMGGWMAKCRKLPVLVSRIRSSHHLAAPTLANFGFERTLV